MIILHAGSGSPYAWRVWLALEHKGLPHEVRMLSFSERDTKKPDFLRLNPRGRVPTLVDDGFALWESAAIVEYLDHAYPSAGRPLFPREPRAAAVVRRMVREADQDYGVPNEVLVEQILMTAETARDAGTIARARGHVLAELEVWERHLADREWLADDLGAADYTLYPLLALTLRMEKRAPVVDVAAHVGPAVQSWMKRVEGLAWFDRTYPHHWRG